MRRLLIDTNVYTAFKRRTGGVLEVLRGADFIGINTVVLAELYSGFKGGSKEEKNKYELNQFLDKPRVELVQIDDITAEFYAQIYWNLRKKGSPIPTNDIWIAASAMQMGLALYSLDIHFQLVEGLLFSCIFSKIT